MKVKMLFFLHDGDVLVALPQGLKQSAIDEKVLESIRSRMVGFEYVHEKFEDPIRAQVPSWAIVNDRGVQKIYPRPES